MKANYLSLDIETTGLDPWRDKITCVGQVERTNSWVLRPPLEVPNPLGTWDLTGHNLKFDLKFLLVNGVPKDLVNAWEHDSQLMAHVCTDKIPESWLEQYELQRKELNKTLPVGVTHRQAKYNSLKTNAPYWLGVPAFWEDPTNHDNDDYVLKDCRYTLELTHLFEAKLKELGQYDFYKNKMMPWAKMLLFAELRGIKLDMAQLASTELLQQTKVTELRVKLDDVWKNAHIKYFAEQERELQAKYDEMKAKAIQKYDLSDPKQFEKAKRTSVRYTELCQAACEKLEKKINFESPKQMTWLLRDYLGLDIETFEGEESTGKSVLEKLADQGHDDVKLFLEFRKENKILTSFLPTYKELQFDGVIHPTFNETGTRTGRLSSSSPNMQQVPPSLYKLFAPRDGYSFLQYDYSGIEAALIAYYSEDPMLYDALNSGHSIHDANAKVFFGFDDPVDQIKELHPKERYVAKHIGFALFYGAGTKRILETFANFGIIISKDKAREILENFKEHYQKVFAFHKEITGILESGEVVRNLIGRPIKIQAWESAHMSGFNTLVQSSASDLLLDATHSTWKEFKDKDLDAHPLLFVHDMALIEVKTEQAEEADKIFRKHLLSPNLQTPMGQIKLQIDGGIKQGWEK